MTVYRISGDGLLTLARLASASPDADPDTVLAIVMGCDREAPMPDVEDGPDLSADKPAKPE
jgi:hypothetical protein